MPKGNDLPRGKAKKIRKKGMKSQNQTLKKSTFRSGGRLVYYIITHWFHVSNKFLYLWDIVINFLKNNSMDGLKMRDGRLVSDRPIGVTGIAQAAQMRKQNKQRSSTQNIALGIELASQKVESRAILSKFMK